VRVDLTSTGVTDISEIGRGIGKAPNLSEVHVELNGTGVNDISEIGRGIKTAPKLAKFVLKCELCKDLVDVQELGRGIGKAPNLSEVRVDLNFTGVTGISEIGLGIGKAPKLFTVHVDVKCTGVTDIIEFACHVQKAPNISEFVDGLPDLCSPLGRGTSLKVRVASEGEGVHNQVGEERTVGRGLEASGGHLFGNRSDQGGHGRYVEQMQTWQ